MTVHVDENQHQPCPGDCATPFHGGKRSAAASLLGGGVMHADPVAALEDLRIDAATAIAALEATGGDLDRAVLSLFPAD